MKIFKVLNPILVVLLILVFFVYWFYFYIIADDIAMFFVTKKGLFTSYQEFQNLITITIMFSLFIAILVTAILFVIWIKSKTAFKYILIIHIFWIGFMLFEILTSHKFIPIVRVQL